MLDGETGRVLLAHLYGDDSRVKFPCLLASDASSLTRMAAAFEEFRTNRGDFSRFAGRYGPDVVEDLTELLLDAIREHDPKLLDSPSMSSSLEAAWIWKVVATVQPLARIAMPGRDLVLDLPSGLLDAEFSKEELARFNDVDLPEILTHQPTRQFLVKHCLPAEGMFTRSSMRPLTSAWDHWNEFRAKQAAAWMLPHLQGLATWSFSPRTGLRKGISLLMGSPDEFSSGGSMLGKSSLPTLTFRRWPSRCGSFTAQTLSTPAARAQTSAIPFSTQ